MGITAANSRGWSFRLAVCRPGNTNQPDLQMTAPVRSLSCELYNSLRLSEAATCGLNVSLLVLGVVHSMKHEGICCGP